MEDQEEDTQNSKKGGFGQAIKNVKKKCKSKKKKK